MGRCMFNSPGTPYKQERALSSGEGGQTYVCRVHVVYSILSSSPLPHAVVLRKPDDRDARV